MYYTLHNNSMYFRHQMNNKKVIKLACSQWETTENHYQKQFKTKILF